MTREDQLCLLLDRGQLIPEVRNQILELLSTSLQWPLVLERAYSHEVYPLLYHRLRALGFPGVPQAVQTELKGAYLANAWRNELFAEELARLLGLLGHAGIRVIRLKKVALAKSLCGDPAARVCSDIDILVPPGEAARERRIILTNGYSSQFSDEFFVNHQLRGSAECPLARETKTLTYIVVLHWTLLHSSSKDQEATENLWSRPQEFFGVRAYDLTPEWQFLYLPFHAAYNKWSTLKWLADAHDPCTSVTLDWDQVKESTEIFELDTFARPTLAACSALFGIQLPAQIPARALPANVLIFPYSLSPSESWEEQLFYPRLLKRRSDKLRWFARVLCVPNLADQKFVRLPASLTPVLRGFWRPRAR